MMTISTLRRVRLALMTALALGPLAFSCAPASLAADAPATPAAPTSADPGVIEVLDKLEARGKEILSLQAKLRFQKIDTLLGDDQTRLGELTYVTENAQAEQPAKFVIDFTQLLVDDAPRNERRQYIFDGIWLVEKQFARKMFMKRQILAPGQKFNPLDMDGPFPVPLGQKRAEVLARYEVKIMPTTDAQAKDLDLAAPPLHLRLIPRAGTPGKVRFTSIDLWFDRATMLPAKVHAVDSNKNETNVWLTAVKMNAEPVEKLAERFKVDVPPASEGWSIDIAREP